MMVVNGCIGLSSGLLIAFTTIPVGFIILLIFQVRFREIPQPRRQMVGRVQSVLQLDPPARAPPSRRRWALILFEPALASGLLDRQTECSRRAVLKLPRAGRKGALQLPSGSQEHSLWEKPNVCISLSSPENLPPPPTASAVRSPWHMGRSWRMSGHVERERQRLGAWISQMQE